MTERRGLDLSELRCVKCKQLLAKMEPDALRTGKLLEIKCAKCNAFLTMMGDEPDSQHTITR